MSDISTKPAAVKAAGIDMAKAKFDVAVDGTDERFTASNTPEGHRQTAEQLTRLGVTRVGVEATGNYEAGLVGYLRAAGFTVVVLDPAQVHGYRRFKKQRAKTDPIDATLIGAVTAAISDEEIHQAPDPRLAPFCEHLTMIEQIVEDIARLKTRWDRFSSKHCLDWLKSEIARLERRVKTERGKLVRKIEAHADLKARYQLAQTIPGVGEGLALTVIVRVPELGSVSREQAAALVGVAPYNVDTGEHAGERHIAGGRARPRKAFFMAAFAGCNRWNPELKAFYDRLRAKGKPHKLALTGAMRKLVIMVNAVLARGTPWVDRPAQL
jgi:transposase